MRIPPSTRATGASKPTRINLDSPRAYAPLTGQQALFSDAEIAAARGEVVAGTAPEDGGDHV
jgi:hypothetical protein